MVFYLAKSTFTQGKTTILFTILFNNRYIWLNVLTEDKLVILDLQIHQDHKIRTI